MLMGYASIQQTFDRYGYPFERGTAEIGARLLK
jgi:hypothetical protein